MGRSDKQNNQNETKETDVAFNMPALSLASLGDTCLGISADARGLMTRIPSSLHYPLPSLTQNVLAFNTKGFLEGIRAISVLKNGNLKMSINSLMLLILLVLMFLLLLWSLLLLLILLLLLLLFCHCCCRLILMQVIIIACCSSWLLAVAHGSDSV